MEEYKITGEMLRDMILSAASLLEENKEALNSLNVFPVPDGDTGTNMTLTMMSAVKEINSVTDVTVHNVAQALALGSLKGARGNSGVILSQLFRGFTQACTGLNDMTTADFAAGLRLGVECAYKAVMKPKEGTILTVARSMADAAVESEDEGVLNLLDNVLREGEKTLIKTPDMLSVLKEAGVVDAGGKGLLIIYSGYKAALNGNQISIDFESMAPQNNEVVESSNAEIEFGYCTEFFIKQLRQGIKLKDVDDFREKLSNIGDCVLVVGDLMLVKVHVHTNEPDKALNEALKLGSLSGIKIDNMREQHNEIIGDFKKKEKEIPQKDIAVVSIAAGEGICAILKELGVDLLVEGGQTMNPSAHDIATAVDSVPSQNVIILPNNKNIILAATQAKSLTGKNIEVVPSKSIPQGISAMMAFNPELKLDENAEKMTKALSNVKTGVVTQAIRDSGMNGRDIKKDEFIGIFESKIVVNKPELDSIPTELLSQMVDEDDCVITGFFGENVNEDDAKELLEEIQDKFPDCDVDMQCGGQPVYMYIFAVE
ncbi:MAG: DAK2 domain-containing protein [Eubacteriales bacterium]